VCHPAACKFITLESLSIFHDPVYEKPGVFFLWRRYLAKNRPFFRPKGLTRPKPTQNGRNKDGGALTTPSGGFWTNQHDTNSPSGCSGRQQEPLCWKKSTVLPLRIPPALGARKSNAAKKYLNHAPFGSRPFQLVARGSSGSPAVCVGPEFSAV
jgi:hypothetical protein